MSFTVLFRRRLVVALALLCAGSLRAYDMSGTSHSVTDQHIAQRLAAQEWMDEAARGRHEPTVYPWQRDIANAAERARADELERRALEQQRAWAAERARQEQAAREKLEAENRLWSDALNHPDPRNPLVHTQRVEAWQRAGREAAAQGRVLTLGVDDYDAYFQLRLGWLQRMDENIDAAYSWGMTQLTGPYGTARDLGAAERAFLKSHSGYFAGLSNFLLLSRLRPKPRDHRLGGNPSWIRSLDEPGFETNADSRRRASLCLLAATISRSGLGVRDACALVLHRALAAQHAALQAHPEPVRGPDASGTVWLDAGTARVLWDFFSDQPQFAPSSEIQDDFLRLFREAEDPISHAPADFYGANLPEWKPQGALADVAATAEDLQVLQAAEHLSRQTSLERTSQFLLQLADASAPRLPPDAGLASLVRELVDEQFHADLCDDDAVKLVWSLAAPLVGDAASVHVAARADPAFAAKLRVATQLVLPPQDSAGARALVAELIRWHHEEPANPALRHALAVLGISHPEILDDAATAAVLQEAVRQVPGEPKLLPELSEQCSLSELFQHATDSEERQRHPLFWALLTCEQLERPAEACEALRAVDPATPAVLDLLAACSARLGEDELEATYDAQVAALAVPVEQRHYSDPAKVLAACFAEVAARSERGKETESVREARAALAAATGPGPRQAALARLVALQADADAQNLPNETALAALEEAAGAPDPDGLARTAFLTALHGAHGWEPVAAARRSAAAGSPELARWQRRFGGVGRAVKGWNLLLAAYAQHAAWAVAQVDPLDLAEARAQLRELIADDFGTPDGGHFILQAYLAAQSTRDEAAWHARLAQLQPSGDATALVQALVRGVRDPWSAPGLAGAAAESASRQENEACLDCLVSSFADREFGPPGERRPDKPVFYWGVREALEALAGLGAQLPRPRDWSEAEFGQFVPECFSLYFRDLLAMQLGTATPAEAAQRVAQLPLDLAVLGADSFMRERGRFADQPTLLGLHDFLFGEWLLASALDPVPNGHRLARQLVAGEITPAELIAQLPHAGGT